MRRGERKGEGGGERRDDKRQELTSLFQNVRSILKYYGGSVMGALLTLFQEIGLDESKFAEHKSKYSKKSERRHERRDERRKGRERREVIQGEAGEREESEESEEEDSSILQNITGPRRTIERDSSTTLHVRTDSTPSSLSIGPPFVFRLFSLERYYLLFSFVAIFVVGGTEGGGGGGEGERL